MRKKCSVFVGHLNPSTTEDTLKLMFERFGKIVEVNLLLTPERKSRCAAFVEFQSPLAVERLENAIQSRPITLDYNIIAITRSLSTPTSREPHLTRMSVQGIPAHATLADIARPFKTYGVASLKMWHDDRGRFIGDAFVTFNTTEIAQKAYVDACLQPVRICDTEVIVASCGWSAKHLRPPSDQLCVQNIPWYATQPDLGALFKSYGTVKAVVWTYAISGRRKYLAYVYFDSKDVTARIMEAHAVEPFAIGRCQLKIYYAQRFLPSLFNRSDSWHMQFRERLRQEKSARKFRSSGNKL